MSPNSPTARTTEPPFALWFSDLATRKISENWLLSIAIVAGLSSSVVWFFRRAAVREAIERIVLRIPAIGTLVRGVNVGGRNRLYSKADVVRLREIADLSTQGLSLEGIRRVLELQEEVRILRMRLEEFTREKASTSLVVWRPSRTRT